MLGTVGRPEAYNVRRYIPDEVYISRNKLIRPVISETISSILLFM